MTPSPTSDARLGHRVFAPIALAAVILASCSRSPSELGSTPAPSPPERVSNASDASTYFAPNLPLVWDDPSAWTRRRPKTDNRAAEYVIPRGLADGGDSEDAECVVLTFGPRQGGTPEQNLDRWIGQFTDQTERPVKAARPSNRKGGLEIKRVEVAGTYIPMQLFGEHTAPEPKHGYRLIGAVVEAPSGLWFFKLTGPDATVKAAAHDFDHMVQTAHPRQ